MSMAESECGSSPSDFMRLKVSRQEMPASTRIFVLELDTSAQFPRLPEASMETLTPMLASILGNPVDSGVTFWLADTFGSRPAFGFGHESSSPHRADSLLQRYFPQLMCLLKLLRQFPGSQVLADVRQTLLHLP